MATLVLHLLLLLTFLGTSAIHIPGDPQSQIWEHNRQELDNFADLQYYCKMKLGKTDINVLIDTASVELVVFSEKCKYWCGIEKNFYKDTDSGFYINGPLSAVLSYSTGNLYGNEAYDRAFLGKLSTTRQPFWYVTDADMLMLFDTKFSGIMGLGPITPNMHSMVPGLSHNEMRYALSLRKFLIWRYSLCLNWQPGSKGYIKWNDDIVDQKPWLFTPLALLESKFWLAQLKNVYLGGKPIGCFSGCAAILDSATPLLAMPNTAYEVLGDAIASLASDCSKMHVLPDLTFTLGDQNYSLPPDSYFGDVHGRVSKNVRQHFKIDYFNKSSNNTCQPTIMRVALKSSLGDTWVFGAPFFRSYFTVFIQSDPPHVHTTPAPENCDLSNQNSSDHTHFRGYAKLQTKARLIDASKLHLPLWLTKVTKIKDSPPTIDTLGRNVTLHSHDNKHKRGRALTSTGADPKHVSITVSSPSP